MNRQELKRMFEQDLISLEDYKEELFKLENQPKQPRKPKRVYEGITEEEFIKLLKETRTGKHFLIYILAYGSGLRLSEIIGKKNPDGSWKIPPLQKDSFDFKTRRLFIHGKGSKDRIVNTPKWMKEKHLKLIPVQLKRRAAEAGFLRASMRAGINKVMGQYKTGSGKIMPLYRLKIHSLRRGYCLNLFKKNVPPNTIQALMGHENLATTSRYSHVPPQDAVQGAIDAGM